MKYLLFAIGMLIPATSQAQLTQSDVEQAARDADKVVREYNRQQHSNRQAHAQQAIVTMRQEKQCRLIDAGGNLKSLETLQSYLGTKRASKEIFKFCTAHVRSDLVKTMLKRCGKPHYADHLIEPSEYCRDYGIPHTPNRTSAYSPEWCAEHGHNYYIRCSRFGIGKEYPKK